MNYLMLILTVLVASLMACTRSQHNPQLPKADNREDVAAMNTIQPAQYRKGDLVPAAEVCMVNDAFMAKKQLLVEHNGKMYYGCCQMCKDRIPREQAVRIATDPFSGKTVDKAEAIIAITGDRGEVSYFENEANYRSYFKHTN
ncbi:hypothetical protein [Sphingobacterium thalpophilum]|uniref:hypothetical protein n=1 Tax=Sphingobacterium thalpophilum TaxID=259 RepID=UPI0024A71972|nr:hypothetical protein [Sphingobacterium thalpophilum]